VHLMRSEGANNGDSEGGVMTIRDGWNTCAWKGTLDTQSYSVDGLKPV